jgi:hypothetical protein
MAAIILEADEQKALVTRCRIEGITVISIENSLQFPIEAILEIVKPYLSSTAVGYVKPQLQKLLSMLTQKRKNQGMLIGCPDLFFPEYRLFIELKRRDGGVVSLEQKKIHELLKQFGYRVEVCHGAKAAWQVIEEERNEI